MSNALSRLAPALAASLLLAGGAACGDATGPGLDTAAQDTFGIVYPSSRASAARSLHVEWSRGPVTVGASRPFTRDSVHGLDGQLTDLWGGQLAPGDTAVLVLGYDGEKPRVLLFCFSDAPGPLLRCAGG